jgi:hypothetical protein
MVSVDSFLEQIFEFIYKAVIILLDSLINWLHLEQMQLQLQVPEFPEILLWA